MILSEFLEKFFEHFLARLVGKFENRVEKVDLHRADRVGHSKDRLMDLTLA